MFIFYLVNQYGVLTNYKLQINAKLAYNQQKVFYESSFMTVRNIDNTKFRLFTLEIRRIYANINIKDKLNVSD